MLIDGARQDTSILGGKTISILLSKISHLDDADRASPNSKYLAGSSTFHLDHLITSLELEIWRELIESLHAANACGDSLDICQEAVRKFPSAQWFRRSLELTKAWYEARTRSRQESPPIIPHEWRRASHDGEMLMREYPWLTADILHRDPASLRDAQKEMEAVSSKCTIARSSVRNSCADQGQGGSKLGALGLFTTKNIQQHETILVDQTNLGVTNAPNCCQNCCCILPYDSTTLLCCGGRYCSQDCADRALLSHHLVLCKKDFSFISDNGKGASSLAPGCTESLFYVRLWAIVVQEAALHPLKTSVIARLTRQYEGDFTIGFNLSNHIINPIRILQTLGIDVFTDARYDTWVLHTIRCTLSNNWINVLVGDDRPILALMPLYSFQNHSCDPSVREIYKDDSSTSVLIARRDIMEGEEITGMYIPASMDGYNMSRDDRHVRLRPWIGGICRCAKCDREKGAVATNRTPTALDGDRTSNGQGQTPSRQPLSDRP